MHSAFKDFTASERKVLARLNTPAKIQDFLDALPMNFSEADPCLSVRGVLQHRTAHCMEGALFAAAALWFHGYKPLLLDLTTTPNDEDHVVALFQEKAGGRVDSSTRGSTAGRSTPARRAGWGAISKTNHAVLRYREPVYKSVRELAMSYFHEYFLNTAPRTASRAGQRAGQKTLRTFSTRPFDLSTRANQKYNWLTSQDGIMEIIEAMANAPHSEILTTKQIKKLRLADAVEIQAGKIVVDRPHRKR